MIFQMIKNNINCRTKKGMAYFIPLFLLSMLGNISVKAQSAAIYLCNNCTYESSVDKQTITFNLDGSVKLNGKLNKDFKCKNNDGIVILYYKNKEINALSFDFDGSHPGCLKDKRAILYCLVSCKGSDNKK